MDRYPTDCRSEEHLNVGQTYYRFSQRARLHILRWRDNESLFTPTAVYMRFLSFYISHYVAGYSVPNVLCQISSLKSQKKYTVTVCHIAEE